MKKHRLLTWLLSIIIGTVSLSAQQYTMNGTVVDENGDGLIGASVRVKGSSDGVMTDIDGNFALKVQTGGTITVTYIGYVPQEIPVTGQNNIKVTLQPDQQVLEEVVVVGYGTMRKKDLTGSVVQINPDKIADQNPATVQDLLRGTPGLQIGYDPSAKGNGASIRLRGTNSLYGTKDGEDASHNSPLIVVDGMQFYGELSELNPDDIAQIDVLKDASSAAIYGAKAASGVIIITTKKGKEGKPVINVSANIGLAQKSSFMDYMSADQYMKYREDWYKATTYGYDENGNWGYYSKDSGVPAGYYDHYSKAGQFGLTQEQWASMGSLTLMQGESMESLYARRLLLNNASNVFNNYLAGKTVDWNDEVWRTGVRQDYNASVSGATQNVNYYFSFGYLNNEGVVRGDKYHSYRSNIKLNAKVTDWLEVGANVNFQDRTDDAQAAETRHEYWHHSMLLNSPYASLYNEDGTLCQYPMNGNNTNGGYNKRFEDQYIELEKGYTVLNSIFNAKVTLPFGFTYQFNIAPRYQWFHDRYFESAELPGSDPKNRGVNREQNKRFDWNLNNTLTWDRTFNKVHHFTVTLAQEAEENRFWKDRIEAREILPSDALGFHFIDNANKELSKFSSDDNHSTAAAYLGRVFYGYDDRYMFTGTLRRDGYSAFGSNNPWATFWSAGASWRFSNEKFVNLPWLDDGKLRVSYGTNGNRQLANTYLSLANLKSESIMVYLNNGTAVPINTLKMDRLGNPNLEWEKTDAFNIGLDFAVLNYRLTGSIEYYDKRTKNMIMGQRLPSFTGFGSITTNLGEVTNKGFEITLNSTNITMKDFEWRTSLGFSYNQNRIKHLYYDYDENGVERNDTDSKWYIGHPIGEIWDYEVDGIWGTSPEDIAAAALVGQKPGDPKVVNHFTEDDKTLADGTKVPVYNDKDKVYLGTTNPPIYWNMRNDFTFWKDLTFSFSLYSYMGHKSLSGWYLNGDNGGSEVSNAFNKPIKSYWTPGSSSDKYGRLNATGPNGATGVQKLYNRNFVRLDNISLGYTLPRAWTRKASIDKLRLTFSINNVCTFDSWEYGDPETGNYGTRNYNFGVNLTI